MVAPPLARPVSQSVTLILSGVRSHTDQVLPLVTLALCLPAPALGHYGACILRRSVTPCDIFPVLGHPSEQTPHAQPLQRSVALVLGQFLHSVATTFSCAWSLGVLGARPLGRAGARVLIVLGA